MGVHRRALRAGTVVLALAVAAALGRAATQTEKLGEYYPLKAAPDQHKSLLENPFVLVLDVSIPAGVTVPAHLHPWPAVFITLQPSHLVFKNLAGKVVREVKPPSDSLDRPKVDWREPDAEPASVTNVSDTEMRALRVELKFLGP